ncbi:non-ribosomal peptide synthetase [Dictyobacter kobayashii]|uniref:Carrier domain-containing protein n=1 Tax=Dictyobacter kobayashii TaxID=2014872 RepID=A0A402ASK2_9CHLR|nr:non-ribosomal peptide synthetase [Dictyobacter kobayashii]GCE22080.1 hypothetical protein KDK_58800 [Dictyobacter kobayashii]
MVLLASWSILLGRLSGQQDLVIGSPIAGRKRVELEGLIGFFVNTLALRIDLSGEPCFRQVLERLREVALGAYAHQELPFEKLVEELAPGRDLSYQPLFQTMFILQNTPRALTTFSDLRMQPLEVDNQTAKFDLTLELYDLEHTFEGSLEYMSDLFAPATIQRWLAQWQCLLTAALQAPEHPIASLPLEPEAQLRQRWADWNACAHPLPEAQDLVALFTAQVRQRPEGVALLSEGATLTYRQLNAQANQLAHRLLAAGLELEGRVGVYLPRTPQLVVALLAILKAGGAYVPLDPGLPEERVRWMVRDAQVQYVLSSSALCSQPLEPTVPWWWLDRLAEEELPELDPARAIEPQQLAYLLYTSGSTGEPKGVMGTHQGIINRLAWAWRAYPFAAGEVCCQKTSLSFVDAVAELFTPLLAGVPTVLATQQHCQDAAELLRLLAQHRVSRLVLVPSLLRTLLALEPKLGERLPALRLWMCSGEALPAELCERFQAELPDRVLLNIYGSSEVAADATAWPVQAGEHAPAIGRPLDRVRVYVLDPAGQPVPVGVSGEIYVGGPGLARGYAGQAGQTAERFVPDGISGQEGARLYRTGDLGRYRADGVLEYVGRVDQQIKLRGIRIEVAEIERWMQQAPGVQRAVVVVLEQASGEAWLVGCVQARTGQDVDVEQVRHTLKQRVPGYMVPQRYVKVEQIPLTSSGKVDRQRLRRQVEQEQGAQEQERYREPETPVEQEVARIWEEVLQTQRVGRYDNFFERGGHSLLATQVAARIRDRFQVALPLQRLFEAPILQNLAATIQLEQERHNTDTHAQSVIPHADRDLPLPLSLSQERMWFLDQLEPGNLSYNISSAFLLQGLLRVDILQQSLNALLERHESLRTTFVSIDGKPQQKILEHLVITLSVVDISHETAAQREITIKQQVRQVFDLASGPLLRAQLYRIGEQEHVLVLTIHHIIADGWSMQILMRELAVLYRAGQQQTTPLPPLAIQYADYASWQRHHFLDEQLVAEQLTYWHSMLDNAPALLELPTDHPRPLVQSYRGAKETIQIPLELNRAIKQLGLEQNATPYMVLLAAWSILLGRLSGQQELVVGSPIANRQHKDLEAIIGLFINTLALRIDLSGMPSFAELVERVRRVALGAYEHQEFPFEKLVEELAPERNLNIPPIFQTMFILQSMPVSSISLPDLNLQPLMVDGGFTQYDLVLDLVDSEQGFIGSVDYNADLFEPETIQRWIKQFLQLLTDVLNAPTRALMSMPLLDLDELSQSVYTWNATALPAFAWRHIVELIESRVAVMADRTAIVAGPEQLSYQELNRRANRLARVLRRKGLASEMRVGICLTRSCDLIVAILAVLKAGGAYVPLDPALPAERLAFMLTNAHADLLLTHSTYAPLFSSATVPFFYLDQAEAMLEQEAVGNLSVNIHPAQAAYVLYTSGSTGQPKGVVVEQRNLLNAYYAWESAYKLNASHMNHLQMANVSFDVFSGDLVRALGSGGTLVLCPRELLLEPEQLYAHMGEQQIHCAEFVPAVMRGLLDYLERTAQHLSSMRLLVVGSEGWSMQEYSRLQEVCGQQTRIINSYGVSEATIDSTYFECSHPHALNIPAVPIGHPMGNMCVYLLDQYGQPVPIGATGEMYIGGLGVSRGYNGQPDLTAARFIPDAWSGRSGARLYRTGDLARYREDGTLEFIGRGITR